MPTVYHDGLSVSGLVQIYELLTSKHRPATAFQAICQYILASRIWSHMMIKIIQVAII